MENENVFWPAALDISFTQVAEGLSPLLRFSFLGSSTNQMKVLLNWKTYFAGQEYEPNLKRSRNDRSVNFKN
jgi:hypothetical protein